jgi:hypothetical protein
MPPHELCQAYNPNTKAPEPSEECCKGKQRATEEHLLERVERFWIRVQYWTDSRIPFPTRVQALHHPRQDEDQNGDGSEGKKEIDTSKPCPPFPVWQ